MNKFLVTIYTIIAALLCCSVQSFALEPEDVNFKDASGRQYMVADPDNYLSATVKAEVEKLLTDLRLEKSVEVAVVLPSSIGDYEPNQWCEKVFTNCGIGKSDKDNGLLVMISPESRVAYIMTGYGMEGVFPDIMCKQIVDNAIIPAMKEGNIDNAVMNAVSLIDRIARDPNVAQELASKNKENLVGEIDALDAKVLLRFLAFVVVFMFLVSLILYIRDCSKCRKIDSNYSKAEYWRSHIVSYLLTGVLSCFLGMIFALLAYLKYRSWRNRPLTCATCGAKMKRLPEDKDNELLSDSQDFEEQLNTVDYDVWECPSCGTIERFPFHTNQKKFTECPSCHTVAMCLECDMVVRQSTIKNVGEGVKIYECKYCRNRLRKPYVIPKKEDPSAAIAAAAIVGSAVGRGNGNGGGGFGGFGGFGGGATGGGGAGGRW